MALEGVPISTYIQLPSTTYISTSFPPIMDTLELLEGKRPCLYFVKSFLVENWKSRYARLCLLKFFKTSVFCLTGNSVHCHHQSPHGEEVQAVLHCCDTTNGSTWNSAWEVVWLKCQIVIRPLWFDICLDHTPCLSHWAWCSKVPVCLKSAVWKS